MGYSGCQSVEIKKSFHLSITRLSSHAEGKKKKKDIQRWTHECFNSLTHLQPTTRKGCGAKCREIMESIADEGLKIDFMALIRKQHKPC